MSIGGWLTALLNLLNMGGSGAEAATVAPLCFTVSAEPVLAFTVSAAPVLTFTVSAEVC